MKGSGPRHSVIIMIYRFSPVPFKHLLISTQSLQKEPAEAALGDSHAGPQTLELLKTPLRCWPRLGRGDGARRAPTDYRSPDHAAAACHQPLTSTGRLKRC